MARELLRSFSTPEAARFCQRQIANALASDPLPLADAGLGEGVVHRIGQDSSSHLEVWPQARVVRFRTESAGVVLTNQNPPTDVWQGELGDGRVVFENHSQSHRATLVVNADGSGALVFTNKPDRLDGGEAQETKSGGVASAFLAPSVEPVGRLGGGGQAGVDNPALNAGQNAEGENPFAATFEPTPVGRDSEETRPTEKDGRVRLTGTVGAEPNFHETSDGRPRIVFPVQTGEETIPVYATGRFALRHHALGLMPGDDVRVTGVNHEVRGEQWTYAYGVARQGKEPDGAVQG